jgi:hypothetical protein
MPAGPSSHTRICFQVIFLTFLDVLGDFLVVYVLSLDP